MTIVVSAAGIPSLRRAIAHWEKEIANTKQQIASAKYPQHAAASSRYVAECRGFIRRLNAEIHALRSQEPTP